MATIDATGGDRQDSIMVAAPGGRVVGGAGEDWIHVGLMLGTETTPAWQADGKDGNDTLIAEDGNDTLYGGAGE